MFFGDIIRIQYNFKIMVSSPDLLPESECAADGYLLADVLQLPVVGKAIQKGCFSFGGEGELILRQYFKVEP
jgi:hypothetical protein